MKKPLDLTSFGLTTDLDDNDTILDVIVLIRHVNSDCGHDGIAIASSPGISWLTSLGMVSSAQAIMKAGIYQAEDAE